MTCSRRFGSSLCVTWFSFPLQEKYEQYVRELISHQTEAVAQQRLLEAFSALTPASLPLTPERRHRIQFLSNFDHFLINVRGFLCVK